MARGERLEKLLGLLELLLRHELVLERAVARLGLALAAEEVDDVHLTLVRVGVLAERLLRVGDGQAGVLRVVAEGHERVVGEEVVEGLHGFVVVRPDNIRRGGERAN